MAFDLTGLGFFDGDVYNFILQGVLGVRPTGDPIKDSVYLLVLPILTLYLFSDHVSNLLRIGHTKLKWAFMAIVFFFVIQRGFYPLVAQYALFAFIVLLIWGAWTFITGKKYASESGGGGGGGGHRMEVYDTDTSRRSLNPISLIRGKVVRDIKGATGVTDEIIRQEITRAIEEGRGDDAAKFQQLLRERKK